MDTGSSRWYGSHVESTASPRRVVALRRLYANRKSISASEADDVQSTRRRNASVDVKYRPPSDVNGMYIANVLLMKPLHLPFLLCPRLQSPGHASSGQ